MLLRLLPSLLVGLALLFALASCGHRNSASKNANATSGFGGEIRLDDATADLGCLSVPKLFAAYRNIDPGRASVTLPTTLTFEPAGARESFRRLLAYGQLVIRRQSVGEARDLPLARQDGCEKIYLAGSDGAEKEFAVTSSGKDFLTARAEDGEGVTYTWLSPQRLEFQHRYAVMDQPCGTGNKPVWVTVQRVIDWSDAGLPATVPEKGSALSIDPEFLALAAAAVGGDAESFYVSQPDGSRAIDLAKVEALSGKRPSAEVLSCNGEAGPTPSEPSTPAPDQPAPAPDVNPAPAPDQPAPGPDVNPTPAPDQPAPIPDVPAIPFPPDPNAPPGDPTPGPSL